MVQAFCEEAKDVQHFTVNELESIDAAAERAATAHETGYIEVYIYIYRESESERERESARESELRRGRGRGGRGERSIYIYIYSDR